VFIFNAHYGALNYYFGQAFLGTLAALACLAAENKTKLEALKKSCIH
jgi:hypothetical protein